MDAGATLQNDILTLSTGRIERRYRWNGGHLISESMRDLAGGETWTFPAQRPDLALPGEATEASEGTFASKPFPGNAAWPAHERVTVTCRLGELELRRVFRLYPGVPAIACDLSLRGAAAGPWRLGEPATYSLPGLAALADADRGEFSAPVLETVSTPGRHLALDIAAFFDVTDLRNNLVERARILPYRAPGFHRGNVLLARDLLSDAGFFLIKEAPCSDMQLAWPGCDFVASREGVSIVGLGVDPDDLDLRGGDWVRAYGFVTGLASGGELALLEALRAYQMAIRVRKADRDETIMANTWGDRSQDAVVAEAFSLRELEAGRRLGITHLQLDDGWQTGRSGASVEAGGSLSGIWERGDWWAPRPERFPNGLGPVVARGREVGIEVCLWYNPSKDDSYAHWEDDARTLIDLHREHGIRIFKIDGVNIPDKRADLNLRAMFDRVLEATDHEVAFNLDATAQRRFGYHYLNEYGNVFLENRYSDWGNWYPHWTLRNLWTLSRYVPAQNLQMEFLNRWRNADKYPEDALAPGNVPFEYCFAVTMAAQPLAWFEVQNLPEEAFVIGDTVKRYRELQPRIHAGCILPIGAEPDGTAWTGFQSRTGEGEGFFLVYREHHAAGEASLPVWGLAGRELRCQALLGAAEDFSAAVDDEGRLRFRLPERFSYGVWEYRG